MSNFRMSFFLPAVVVALCCTVGGYAQNTVGSFDKFKEQRKDELTGFYEQRAKEWEEFKARYYSAFEQFRKSYRHFLEDEEKSVDLMASDDGIEIEPIKLAPAPVAVVSTAAEQKRILRKEIKSIATMKPDDLIPVLSQAEDTVVRMQEAAEVMEAIVANMDADIKEDQAPLEPVSTEVVLEPYDPAYFESLPAVEEAGTPEPEQSAAQEQSTPPVQSQQGTDGDVSVSAASASEDSGSAEPAASTAVPSGTPTEYVRISSPFGSRIHPITHKRHGHKGIDLAAPRNTPIYATADGVVTYSGRNGGYGNFVKLNHRNGYKTAYAHMNKISVRKGKSVKKGDLIGYVGSTGASTGNHLHYEVYYQDKLIDPATVL